MKVRNNVCLTTMILHGLLALVCILEGHAAVAADSGGRSAVEQTHSAVRPNILWISCEDISAHLGCYGDRTATTPHLDALAAEGTLYTHAFTCHGVCAPSRTGIITGMTPIALGANHMRSKARLPDHIRLFPEYLRSAGYYCTNNVKTDYNLIWDEKATWDDNSGRAHWKNRPSSDTPFFSVFNLTMTHESRIWPSGWRDVVKDLPPAMRHRPEDMNVPPLFPYTFEIRADYARLADLITVMDQRVGELLRELDDAGLANNTIVIFWSDHGDGLPRCKRWTYDSGTRVPMITRVPESLRELAQALPPGSRDDRMISLIDLGPTVLDLAGIERPSQMHGVPFLGPNSASGAKYIFGARDRIDERFDMVRSVRTRTHRYVRNLMPWRPALQHVAYGEQNESMKVLRQRLSDGTLSPESAQWFQNPREFEELYDLTRDPWELVNVVDSPEYETVLRELRQACDDWQISVRDAHLLPESLLAAEEEGSGNRWMILQGSSGEERTRRLLTAAKSAARADSENVAPAELSDDPAVRWWQVTRLSRPDAASANLAVLQRESRSAIPAIRIAAAAGLSRAGDLTSAADVFADMLANKNNFVRHAAILEIDESGPDLIRKVHAVLPNPADEKEEYILRLAAHIREQIQDSE